MSQQRGREFSRNGEWCEENESSAGVPACVCHYRQQEAGFSTDRGCGSCNLQSDTSGSSHDPVFVPSYCWFKWSMVLWGEASENGALWPKPWHLCNEGGWGGEWVNDSLTTGLLCCSEEPGFTVNDTVQSKVNRNCTTWVTINCTVDWLFNNLPASCLLSCTPFSLRLWKHHCFE